MDGAFDADVFALESCFSAKVFKSEIFPSKGNGWLRKGIGKAVKEGKA